MLGKAWRWITAGIGAVMLALLVAYGTASGTRVDEHSSLLVDKVGQSVDPPSIVGLLIVTVLALVLLIGGSGRRNRQPTPSRRGGAAEGRDRGVAASSGCVGRIDGLVPGPRGD